MSYTSIEDIIGGCCEGKSVDIKGWVYRKRESKEVVFIIIRDSTGIIQCTVKRETPVWDVERKLQLSLLSY